MTRYVIIGSGVAGIAAAGTLRTSDRTAEIFLVSEDPHGFYSRPGLAYYLSDEIPEKQLFVYSKQDWKALNAGFINARVTDLNPQSHQINFNNSDPLKYDRLLLATGSIAAPLTIPGANLRGVVKLDNFEDARRILSLARRAKSAVVVGGGIISLELVEGLMARGIKVHYFMRGTRYWANVLDETESRIIEQRLVHDGVSLHYQTEIAEILERKGRVTAVRTKKGELIRCEMVAVGIGVIPRIDLAQAAGLVTERGILVNEFLQSSHPDIFAAGDVAQVLHPLTGHSSLDTLWLPAREEGACAALNMAGQKQAYHRKVAVNVLRLAGVMLTIIGAVGSGRDDDLVSVARGSSESWLQLPNTIAMESGREYNHLRLMVGDKTLLGALVLGEQKLSLPLQAMIARQVDIAPIRARLLHPDTSSLGHIVMDYWSSLKA